MKHTIISITAGVLLLFGGVIAFTTLIGIKPIVALYVGGWTLAAITCVIVALSGVYVVIRAIDR